MPTQPIDPVPEDGEEIGCGAKIVLFIVALPLFVVVRGCLGHLFSQ